MRKAVSLVLVATLMTMFCSPAAFAQDFAEPDAGTEKEQDDAQSPRPDLDGSWTRCHALGKEDAQDRGTGGSFVGGLAGGVLLGLIGTGIVVLAQSKSDPPAHLLLEIAEEDETCRYTYLESYRSESVSKKRKSALAGGLLGTALFVAFYLVTQDN